MLRQAVEADGVRTGGRNVQRRRRLLPVVVHDDAQWTQGPRRVGERLVVQFGGEVAAGVLVESPRLLEQVHPRRANGHAHLRQFRVDRIRLPVFFGGHIERPAGRELAVLPGVVLPPDHQPVLRQFASKDNGRDEIEFRNGQLRAARYLLRVVAQALDSRRCDPPRLGTVLNERYRNGQRRQGTLIGHVLRPLDPSRSAGGSRLDWLRRRAAFTFGSLGLEPLRTILNGQ